MNYLLFFFFYKRYVYMFFFFFSSRRRHTRCGRDWSSDVCSSDLAGGLLLTDRCCDQPADGPAGPETFNSCSGSSRNYRHDSESRRGKIRNQAVSIERKKQYQNHRPAAPGCYVSCKGTHYGVTSRDRPLLRRQ